MHPRGKCRTLGHERWSITFGDRDDMSTMLGWYFEGGPIMLLILLVGVAGLAILVERIYVIVVRSKNNGRVFIERIIQLVRGGKIEDAIKACAGDDRRPARHGIADFAEPESRRKRSAQRREHCGARGASQVDASDALPADIGQRRGAARRTRNDSRIPDGTHRERRLHREPASRVGSCAPAGGVWRGGRGDVDTWARISRQIKRSRSPRRFASSRRDSSMR